MRSDLQRVFKHLSRVPLGDAQTLPDVVSAMRELTETYGDIEPRRPPEGVEVRSVNAGDIAAEWIIPDGPVADRWTVYLHGGGWVGGSLFSHRPLGVSIAMATGCPVLMVDYRLAPEHPFPAGLNDSVGAFRWALHNGPAGSTTLPRKVYLMGESCGDNLAAAACIQLIQEDSRLPDGLVLISPYVDATLNPDRPPDDSVVRLSSALLDRAACGPAPSDHAGSRPRLRCGRLRRGASHPPHQRCWSVAISGRWRCPERDGWPRSAPTQIV